jgi:iron complex outermembrane receptor protein
MTSTTRTRLIASGLIGLGTIFSATAQESDSLHLEEVIVTAQKRAETLSETPMTVDAISGEEINDFASFSFEDLNSLTAGLAISGNNFDTDIATRGLGTELNAAVSPRVTVYLDGTFINQQRGMFSGIYDVRQVELLRGPQGTLYGQTSPAGAITIQTTNPNLEEIDGYARQSFTDQDGSNSQLGVSLPIIENELGIRLSGLYDTNEASGVENITLDRDESNDTKAFRAVVLWEPAENFDLRLSYHDITDHFDVDPAVTGNGISDDDRKAVADFKSEMENQTNYTILETNYTFANDWVMTFVGSDQNNRVPRYFDQDASEVQSRQQFVDSVVNDVQVYELRLASQEGDFWNWIVGAFYQDTNAHTDVSADTWVIAGPGLNVFADVESTAFTQNETSAVFAHNTLNVSENGTVTLGLRYTEVDRQNSQPFDQTYYLLNPDGTLGPILREVSFNGVAEDAQEQNENAVTGTLKYQYQVSDALMAYVSYDRGWRGGSANISGNPAPPQFGVFKDEDSDNLELGFKWELWDGRGLLNVATYYQLYTDFQFQATADYRDPNGRISIAEPVVNVDEAESYGVDSDLTLLLTENWTVRAALSFNQAELTDAQGVPCTTGEPLSTELWDYDTCDLTGERAGQEAEWSANLGTEYYRHLGSADMEWYTRGLLNAESEYYSQSLQEDLDGYGTLDLFVGLRSAERTWDASVWVKNVTDESAVLKADALPEIPDYAAGVMLDNPYIWVRRELNPRTVGVTLSYNF